ncbi:MAG TPA: hypothetical protein VFE37_27005 [Chloroflexota bacterium]|nr:hypothetical protein [Chloroflexota bacterium]
MSCLGLVFVLMGPLLLLAAWTGGRSPVLALGSVAYLLVGAWILVSHARRRYPR